jgi:hypothetical protein
VTLSNYRGREGNALSSTSLDSLVRKLKTRYRFTKRREVMQTFWHFKVLNSQKDSAPASQRYQCLNITRTNQSVVYRETVAVYLTQTHTKRVQTLRLGSTALIDHGLLILEVSRSHSDTSQSVELLWSSDQPGAETSTWQTLNIQNRYHASGGIRTRNPSKQAAADPDFRPRGHRYRLVLTLSQQRSLSW